MGMPSIPELAILVFILLWILVFIDVLGHKFSGHNKLIWIILLLVINLIAVPLYYLIGRKQKIKQTGEE